MHASMALDVDEVIVVKVSPPTALIDRNLYCNDNLSKSFVGLGIIVNIAIALIGMRSLEVLARAGMVCSHYPYLQQVECVTVPSAILCVSRAK